MTAIIMERIWNYMGRILAPGAGSIMDTEDTYSLNLEMHNNSEAVVVILMLLATVYTVSLTQGVVR